MTFHSYWPQLPYQHVMTYVCRQTCTEYRSLPPNLLGVQLKGSYKCNIKATPIQLDTLHTDLQRIPIASLHSLTRSTERLRLAKSQSNSCSAGHPSHRPAPNTDRFSPFSYEIHSKAQVSASNVHSAVHPSHRPAPNRSFYSHRRSTHRIR